MRPEQLKYPYNNGEPKEIFVEGRVWYLPVSPKKPYCFCGWEAEEFFGCERPVFIEYCSGNGAWIAEKAEEHPEVHWVAIEKKFDRVRRIWSKIHNRKLHNLVVVYGEALQFTRDFLASKTIASVYVNFPDPWPKRHHARHRLLAAPFIEELARILDDEASVNIVTDDVSYSRTIVDLFTSHRAFASKLPPPYYCHELEGYGTSYFEELWRSKGSEIRYHIFSKKGLLV